MDDDLSRFCCLNPRRPDHCKRGHGNLTVCARYGKHQRRLLYCRSCKARFSERKGTPLFDTRLPEDKALAVLAHLADGCGVRQTGRLVGVGTNTVVRYGPQQRRMLACRTCQERFSERKGTPLFDTRLPEDKAISVLQHLQEGCGVRQTGRLVGVDKDTVTRLALKAGGHAEQLHDDLVAFSPQDP